MSLSVYYHKYKKAELRVDNVLPYADNDNSSWTTEVTTTLSLTSGDILRGTGFCV
jgi:hypothetical protein